MDKIIDALQKNKSYKVTEVGSTGTSTSEIDNYRALNSKTDEDKVVEEIATADVVTCAVGPKILKFIAPVIAKGINNRKKSSLIAVIACENAIGATDTLREFIEEKLDDSTKSKIQSKARFANSAIDRIVPVQPEDAGHGGLDVTIEKFYEWCVESQPFQPEGNPPIQGVHFVNDLEPFIERKLFTVNTGHATAAYYGYNRGKKYVHDVLEDKELHDIVEETLKETSKLIVDKHGITAEDQQEYVAKIMKRISNPVLKDEVVRVGRGPMRKLSRKERFIGPASQLAEMGAKYDCLLGGIEMALRFQNVEGEEESEELAQILKEKDAHEATKQLTGLEDSHPLFSHVEAIVKKVQA